MLAQVSIAAATAVVDFNLMDGNTNSQSEHRRYLRGAALGGSAAALDTKVELFRGAVKIAELFNTSTGSPNKDDLFPVGSWIGPNAEIQALVKDAPATNPITLILDFAENV